MKKNTLLVRFVTLLLLGAAAVILFFVWLSPPDEQQSQATPGYSASTHRARVIEILEEGEVDLGGRLQPYQIVRVLVSEGPYAGQRFEVDYGQRQVRPADLRLRENDDILVTITSLPQGGVSAYFTDFVRTPSLLWLLLVFIGFSVLISGWKAVRGLIGIALSFAVILGYIIPQILAGKDPVLVSVAGSFVVMLLTLYIVYGWTLKTHAAALGTLIALVITGLIASYFMNFTRLTGFGSEDALFLIQIANFQINLRGLLLGGFMIGVLGVLDDLVITQSSVVFELRATDRRLDYRALLARSMTVGRDHVAATVNTLVFAYTGAALPMLLLFTLSGQALGNLFNLEFVAEEIVRMLVGSLGLIAAVPITSALAAWLALNRDRLGALGRYLGPEGEGHSHAGEGETTPAAAAVHDHQPEIE
jgi:uncharacterized membrane protein